MYKNASDFSGTPSTITFVSNGGFKFTLSDGSQSNEDNYKIKGTDLAPTELQLIEATLEADFPAPRVPSCAGILLFERTNLPLQEQALFVTGRLATYLEDHVGGDGFAVKALYNVLYQNIHSKTGSTEKYDSEEALHGRKSLTRDDIASLIQRAASRRSFESIWSTIATELAQIGLTPLQIIRTHTSAINYLRDRARGNKSAVSYSRQAEIAIKGNEVNLKSCSTIMEAALIIQLGMIGSSDQPDAEGLGPLLVEAYEATNGQHK